VIFIPIGDISGEDPTRNITVYEGIAEFLAECGAKYLDYNNSASRVSAGKTAKSYEAVDL
jgi:hypothetical protein